MEINPDEIARRAVSEINAHVLKIGDTAGSPTLEGIYRIIRRACWTVRDGLIHQRDEAIAQLHKVLVTEFKLAIKPKFVHAERHASKSRKKPKGRKRQHQGAKERATVRGDAKNSRQAQGPPASGKDSA